jgi:hypothetical protein
VLVEHPDRNRRWAYADILRRAGYDVTICSGPKGRGGERVRCPLVGEGYCPLVEGADVVVSSWELAGSHEILRALVAQRGSRVVFEVPETRAARYADVAEDAVLVSPPLAKPALLEAVSRALVPAEPRAGTA